MNWVSLLLLCLYSLNGFSQTLSPSRTVDWTLAGLKDSSTSLLEINLQNKGIINDGVSPNDSILTNILSTIPNTGAILNFPAGKFLFTQTIHVPNHVILRGRGADKTTFILNLNKQGHGIFIHGSSNPIDTTSLIKSALKNMDAIIVAHPEKFSSGNWIQIKQNDSDLTFSTWAKHSVGQIIQIKSISNQKIILESPLRLDFNITRSPYIQKITPVQNVGLECFKIQRIDDTSPEQSSNIAFTYAVNCWAKGIESENCTFSHIQANQSSNLYFASSYFHHGFNYGGGGKAYGIMLQGTSNECLAENNIFEHLRHSMILQSGANGNVFAYNYSRAPYSDVSPNNASGDIVLHGNYAYANLFEQNICQNIVIDNSHGANGPYNTIFRNRAQLFGIIFSSENSPKQNLLGNEITNNKLPYKLFNYTIQGVNHFLSGNNNKGTIHPIGTKVATTSYAYTEKPNFLPTTQWGGIGIPNELNMRSIPAYDRYHAGDINNSSCCKFPVNNRNFFDAKKAVLIHPNPAASKVSIEATHPIEQLTIRNPLGQVFLSEKNINTQFINIGGWPNGIYFVTIHFSNHQSTTEVFVKQ